MAHGLEEQALIGFLLIDEGTAVGAFSEALDGVEAEATLLNPSTVALATPIDQ